MNVDFHFVYQTNIVRYSSTYVLHCLNTIVNYIGRPKKNCLNIWQDINNVSLSSVVFPLPRVILIFGKRKIDVFLWGAIFFWIFIRVFKENQEWVCLFLYNMNNMTCRKVSHLIHHPFDKYCMSNDLLKFEWATLDELNKIILFYKRTFLHWLLLYIARLNICVLLWLKFLWHFLCVSSPLGVNWQSIIQK